MGQEWIAGSVPRSNRGFLILLGRGVFESESGGPSRVNGLVVDDIHGGTMSINADNSRHKELEMLRGVSSPSLPPDPPSMNWIWLAVCLLVGHHLWEWKAGRGPCYLPLTSPFLWPIEDRGSGIPPVAVLLSSVPVSQIFLSKIAGRWPALALRFRTIQALQQASKFGNRDTSLHLLRNMLSSRHSGTRAMCSKNLKDHEHNAGSVEPTGPCIKNSKSCTHYRNRCPTPFDAACAFA